MRLCVVNRIFSFIKQCIVFSSLIGFIIPPTVLSADEHTSHTIFQHNQGYSFQEELLELKEQLEKMEQEKAEQEQRIEAHKKRIEELETKQSADYSSFKESEKTKAVVSSQKDSWKTSAAITYYWDTREFNTFAVETSTTGLPWGLSFWGFTDLHGTQDEIQDSFDHTRFFMEYRLSQTIKPDWIGGINGLGWQAEYNDANGSSNEVVRLGLTYKHDLPSFTDKKGWLQWRAFPYETDGSGQQLSLIYNVPLTQRLWIGGFIDLNLQEGAGDRWVIEPAIYYKISEHFSLVTEYRYSGFEKDNVTLDAQGVAFGIRTNF